MSKCWTMQESRRSCCGSSLALSHGSGASTSTMTSQILAASRNMFDAKQYKLDTRLREVVVIAQLKLLHKTQERRWCNAGASSPPPPIDSELFDALDEHSPTPYRHRTLRNEIKHPEARLHAQKKANLDSIKRNSGSHKLTPSTTPTPKTTYV